MLCAGVSRDWCRKAIKSVCCVQDELLEIGVDEEEIEELAEEEDRYEVNKSAGLEDESEQLDYNDDLPQSDDVQVEYDGQLLTCEWACVHTHTHTHTHTHVY